MRRIRHESVLNELLVEHLDAFGVGHFLFLREPLYRQSNQNLEELIPDDLSLRIDANLGPKREVLRSNCISRNEGQIDIRKLGVLVVDKFIAPEHDVS